jgi:cytochrome c oxidase accessory protein FixG
MSNLIPEPTPVKPKPVNKERLAPLPPPEWSYHRVRKWIHFACFLIFLALPFLNVMRFDLPRQRFYFAGFELGISEFSILYFTLLFLLFVIVAVALIYGRIYCGYLCPQTIFSEAAQWYESRVARMVKMRWAGAPANQLRTRERILSLAGVGVASVFLAFIFISYFVEPRDLLHRLWALDIQTAGGVAGAVVTLFTFLDFAFVRQRFCTTVCPYGYLQGMLVDKNSLLVHYRDEEKGCIECKKCVRVCPMEIDIRDSPKQIECVHCGECIDACGEVLGRLGKPTLIHYAWGETGAVMGNLEEPWYKRIGFRDPKRIALLFILLFYFSGLITALSMRHTVLVQFRADRGQHIYEIDPNGLLVNKYKAKMSNRGLEPAGVSFRVEGLPGAVIEPAGSVLVDGNAVVEQDVRVLIPSGARAEVLHVKITATVMPGKTETEFATTFLSPPPAAKEKAK